MTTNAQIARAIIVHGDKYDYSLANYKNSRSYITIICKKHGIFNQQANSHLQGKGCIKCKGLNKMTIDEFITKSQMVHNNKYDYSLTEYTNSCNKVKIICPDHGEFWQKANDHISGHGCGLCRNDNKKLTLSNFINTANKIRNNRYDYSLTEYINVRSKIRIICPIHGEFTQTPKNHLKQNGCPKCANVISRPELEICKFLTDNNIKYNQSNRSLIRPYELDIIIPEHKLAIEFNGKYQHSDELIKKTRIGFTTAKDYHQMKTDKCKLIGYKLLHISECDYIINREKELNNIIRCIYEEYK